MDNKLMRFFTSSLLVVFSVLCAVLEYFTYNEHKHE